MSDPKDVISQAREALARYESQNAGDPFNFGLQEHRYVALRDLLALVDAQPTREAVTEILWHAENWVHDGPRVTFSVENATDAILAAFPALGTRREVTDEMVERGAEAAHYAQGFDDYGVANEDEQEDARSIARAALEAALNGTV